MVSRRGSIVKVSPFVPTAVETTVKPAPAELAAAFAKLKTAKPDFPWGGAVKLANADAAQLAKDYAVIEALCHSGLWTIE